MFRKMRRSKQELSEQECLDVLKREPRGVLAVYGEDGYPYAFPMDFLYMDNKLYFHAAREGHKIDAIQANEKVSFCVLTEGTRKEGDWFLRFQSVVVFGRMKKIDDAKKTERMIKEIGLKYLPTPESLEEEIQKAVSRVQVLELSIDHMTGKRVDEK